ncbi:hypothetical protein Anacy_0758 [Anabaena cylindrica PCC 7122]|uniref:Uncharacterized protein n=1 Tax=Anabaena cylindrica (strain ATCC 27899 / PCC 7122) TaxID=272123 RepID=K9ZCM3_ANACC|nr:hypothetical protein Anacy_0758 [Anabaena cylindrica PCC 7122]
MLENFVVWDLTFVDPPKSPLKRGTLKNLAPLKKGISINSDTFQTSSYSGYRLSELQKPHPQPPHRLRGGGYDVPHVMRKGYKNSFFWARKP